MAQSAIYQMEKEKSKRKAKQWLANRLRIKAIGCPIKLILSDLQVEVEPSQMSI
jgi:secreted Zn-dependent insulinase-like peptidase